MYKGDEQTEKNLRLFRILLHASRTVLDNIIKDMKNHGLTSENFMVLELLYNKGPHYIQTISEKLRIPSGSITYVVNRLEEKELVRKVQDQSNKRYWNVVLTESGEKLFNDIFPKHVEVIEDNFCSLSEQQKEELTKLLKTVGLAAENLQQNNVEKEKVINSF